MLWVHRAWRCGYFWKKAVVLQDAGNIKRFNIVMACLLVASVVPLLL